MRKFDIPVLIDFMNLIDQNRVRRFRVRYFCNTVTESINLLIGALNVGQQQTIIYVKLKIRESLSLKMVGNVTVEFFYLSYFTCLCAGPDKKYIFIPGS
jgi:hypothetical protein